MGWTAILSEEEHKLMSIKRHLSGSCFCSFLYVDFGVANGESEVWEDRWVGNLSLYHLS